MTGHISQLVPKANLTLALPLSSKSKHGPNINTNELFWGLPPARTVAQHILRNRQGVPLDGGVDSWAAEATGVA